MHKKDKLKLKLEKLWSEEQKLIEQIRKTDLFDGFKRLSLKNKLTTLQTKIDKAKNELYNLDPEPWKD